MDKSSFRKLFSVHTVDDVRKFTDCLINKSGAKKTA